MLAIEAQIRSVEGWLERHPEWTAQRVNGVARQRGRPEAHRSATAGGLATLRDFLRRKVEEAATDVIALEQARGVAKPWTLPSFIDSVTKLQKLRQIRASYLPDELQFHDRLPICTAALGSLPGISCFTGGFIVTIQP